MSNTVVIKEYRCDQKEAGEKLLVSLPPVWLSQNGIKQGDTLLFCQEPGSSDLIIRKADSSGQRPS